MIQNEDPLSIYIVHWNSPSSCAKTVESLFNQNYPVKITIIDNASAENELNLLINNVKNKAEIIRLTENIGFGPGLNIGLKKWLYENNGEYVVVSAHDSILHEECLRDLVSAMQQDNEIGILSPEYGLNHIAKYSKFMGARLVDHLPGTGFEEQDFPHGTLMMFRRKCLQEIGLFDQRYFAYGDEMDIGLRAKKFGWKVGVLWGARVDNPACSVPTRLAAYLQIRNSILLVRQWSGFFCALIRSILFLLNAVRLKFVKSRRPAFFQCRTWLIAVRDYWLGRLGNPKYYFK